MPIRACGSRPDEKREPAAADEKAAQQRELLMLGIFRDEALRRRAEAEVGNAADQQQPGPGVNVNAEFIAAEPARQNDLRHEGQERQTMRMMKAAPARRRISEELPPPANSARPRAIAPLSSACQAVSQCERGACSERIDATTTSAPRLGGGT